jgi:rhamnosyltransferase
MPKASIIIRTRNEERWIRSCLEAVFGQEFNDLEVVLVDNQSTDRTLEISRKFDVRVVEHRTKYYPGQALNEGIRNSTGDLLVMLSGHCIPTNPRWLEKLLSHFGDDHLAGVYGRQEPLPFTSDRDKRDLWTIFQLDRKVQTTDCF